MRVLVLVVTIIATFAVPAKLALADSIKSQKIIVVSVLNGQLSVDVKNKLTEMLQFSAEQSTTRPARLYIQGVSETPKGTLGEKSIN
jgi:hypothetical protein